MLFRYIIRLWLISFLLGTVLFCSFLETGTGDHAMRDLMLFSLSTLLASALLSIPSFLLLWLIVRLFTRFKVHPVLLKCIMIILSIPLLALPAIFLLLFVDLQPAFIHVLLPFWIAVSSGILFFRLPLQQITAAQA